LLNEHCRAVASPQPDSTWEVRVEVGNAPRNVLPPCLAAAREWVDRCGLASASVTLDGHTHLLRGSTGARVAQE